MMRRRRAAFCSALSELAEDAGGDLLQFIRHYEGAWCTGVGSNLSQRRTNPSPNSISQRIRYSGKSGIMQVKTHHSLNWPECSFVSIWLYRPNERPTLVQLYPFLTAELTRQSVGTTLEDDLLQILPAPEP